MQAYFKAKVGKIDKTTGFLRCRAIAYYAGVWEYSIKDFKELPSHILEEVKASEDQAIKLMVSKEEIEKAIPSLEGADVTIDHKWVSIVNKNEAVGTIISKPYFEGDNLIVELIIKNKEAIIEIQKKELVECSVGLNSSYKWEKDNNKYHGEIKDLHFNHLALLEKNESRGGTTKLINKKRVDMTDKKTNKYKFFNGTEIEIDVEDEETNKKLANLKNAIDEKIKNSEVAEKKETDKKENEKKEMEKKETEKKENSINSQVLELKKEMEEERNNLVDYYQTLSEIDGIKSVNDDLEKIYNSLKGKEVSPDDARLTIVNSFRKENELKELDNNQDKNYIKGCFQSALDNFSIIKNKKLPNIEFNSLENSNSNEKTDLVHDLNQRLYKTQLSK